MFGAKRALDLFVITLMAFWYAQYWSPSPGSISIEWWQSKIIQIIPLDLRFNDLWVELSYNHRDSSIINNSKFRIKINLWIVNAEMVRTMSTAHCTFIQSRYKLSWNNFEIEFSHFVRSRWDRVHNNDVYEWLDHWVITDYR